MREEFCKSKTNNVHIAQYPLIILLVDDTIIISDTHPLRALCCITSSILTPAPPPLGRTSWLILIQPYACFHSFVSQIMSLCTANFFFQPPAQWHTTRPLVATTTSCTTNQSSPRTWSLFRAHPSSEEDCTNPSVSDRERPWSPMALTRVTWKQFLVVTVLYTWYTSTQWVVLKRGGHAYSSGLVYHVP